MKHLWLWFWLWLMLVSLLPALSRAANTHGTPSFQREVQAWFGDTSESYLVSGGLHGTTTGTLTSASFATTAYIKVGSELIYVSQPAATMTYAGSTTSCLALHQNTFQTIGGWTREAATHYLRTSSACSTPPSGGMILAEVTTTTEITAVELHAPWRIAGTQTIAANTTLASESRVTVPPGGTISIDAGITLTLNGTLQAGPYQIFGGTGTVVLGDRIPEIYPHWWGALCDGSTDDSTPFASAIATGKTVRLPSGTCIIDAITTAADADIFLVGAGQTKTVLKHADSAAGLTMLDASTNYADQVILRDLTIDGNQANNDIDSVCVTVGGDTILVENVEFTGCAEVALQIRESGNLTTIQHNYFHDSALHGGTAPGENTVFLHITNTDGNATDIVHVLHNRFEQVTPAPGATPGNGVPGINLSGNAGFEIEATIVGNTLFQTGQNIQTNIISPIHCYEHCDNSVIAHNVIIDSYETAIDWQKSDNFLIEGNIMVGEGTFESGVNGACIAVFNRAPLVPFSNGIVRNNICRDMDDANYAMYFSFGTGGLMETLKVDGNIIEGVQGGILIDGVQGHISVSNNTFTDITTGAANRVIFFSGMEGTHANIIVEGNSFKNTDDYSVYFADGSTRTASLKVRNNHFDDAAATVSQNIWTHNIDFLEVSGNYSQNMTPTVAVHCGTIPVASIHDNITEAGDTLSVTTCGSTYLDVHSNTFAPPTVTLADSSNPSVAQGRYFATGGTTIITDFQNPIDGKTIYIRANHATPFDCDRSETSPNLRCNSGADFTADAGDMITCTYLSTDWHCLRIDD